MSAINEKIIEEIWSSVGPILSVPRILGFILICLFLSPYGNQIFSFDLLYMKLEDVMKLIHKSYKETELWKLLFGLAASTMLSPFLTYLATKYLIASVHIHLATNLIDRLKKLPETALSGLLIKRNNGIKKISILKHLGEFTSLILIGSIYFFLQNFTNSINWYFLILFIFIIWILFIYLVSQRILITFLVDIAPFNFASNT